ncbi:cell division protein FtsZ [Chloroflexota bacterium]
MNILVIGLGQCGGRIADEFSRRSYRAKSKRGLEIINGAFAVSADTSDLIDLTSIKADYKHRILIGAEQLRGFGVNGNNELGAQVMQEHADKVLEEIRDVRQFFETDAILVIAGAAGGIGSGALPVMVQRIKQRFHDKIVYAMVILPYEYEEQEEIRIIYSTAVCLKSVASVADAVILVDNESYKTDDIVKGDFLEINQAIVEPFYNLLCAGAEKRKKHIGAKLLDAGDIIQTLDGWTVLGSGRVDLPTGLASILLGSFRKTNSKISKGIRAMDEAIGEVSLLCKPEDAASALYLISAPAKEISLDLIKELGDYLKQAAPSAIIRSGDYPVGRDVMEVTVILSRLSDISRVRKFYTRSAALTSDEKEESVAKLDNALPEDGAEFASDVPE